MGHHVKKICENPGFSAFYFSDVQLMLVSFIYHILLMANSGSFPY